jgi:hypothetical protein
MKTHRSPRWLLIAGCLAGLICLGLLGLLAVFFLGMVPLGPIGPTFTTAEALAYDVIYETAGAEPDTIEVIQAQPAGPGSNLHAVLVGYAVDSQRQINLILTRDAGQEFFVAPMEHGPAADNDALSAQTILHTKDGNIAVAVYGRLFNAAIKRVAITWPNGRQEDAPITDDTYLWFQEWLPQDDSPEPTQVTGYSAEGTIVSELQLYSK